MGRLSGDNRGRNWIDRRVGVFGDALKALGQRILGAQGIAKGGSEFPDFGLDRLTLHRHWIEDHAADVYRPMDAPQDDFDGARIFAQRDDDGVRGQVLPHIHQIPKEVHDDDTALGVEELDGEIGRVVGIEEDGGDEIGGHLMPIDPDDQPPDALSCAGVDGPAAGILDKSAAGLRNLGNPSRRLRRVQPTRRRQPRIETQLRDLRHNGKRPGNGNCHRHGEQHRDRGRPHQPVSYLLQREWQGE